MEIKKLIEVADVVDSLHQTPEYVDKGIPMVRVTDVKTGELSLQGCLCVSEAVFDKFTAKHVPCEGNIVISRVGTYGNFSYVGSDEKFCLGQNTAIIIPHINSRYLYYYLLSPMMKAQIENRVVGSTQKTLSLKNIKELDIPCFEKSKQDKIASILESIDKKIKNNNRINRNLSEQAQSIFANMFIALTPYGGERPKNWEEKKLGEVCKCELGGTPSRAHEEYWGGDIPWINSGEVNLFRITKPSELITELGLSKSATKLLPVKTTVLAITGATLGQVSLLEIASCANQSVVGVIPNEKMPYEYIYPFIKASINELISHQTGGAQQHINKQNVEGLPIVIPDDKSLAKYVERVSGIYSMITNNCFESEKLITLRDSLLPKLMSGELDVSDLDI